MAVTYVAAPRSRTVRGTPITTFLGQIESSGANFLNMPIGQLIYNLNMEYGYAGKKVFLTTKRGSTLVKDIVNPVSGAAIYLYNFLSEYFVWTESDGSLKYYDSGTDTIITLSTELSGTSQNYFVMYGQQTYSTLYGVNPVDGVYKVSGSTPTYATVTDISMMAIAYSNIGGRNFGVYGHKVFYTLQQVADNNLTNLETWDASTQSNTVSPDDGTGFKFCIDNGETMFFFKDTGIWYLPNANDEPTNWAFPKALADIGTNSPNTVALAKYGSRNGIIYLASDKTLRFFQSQLIRNAGTLPTLSGGESKIISRTFQNILKNIPDLQLANCSGQFFDHYYILNIASQFSARIDTTIVIDTQKLLPKEGSDDIEQPFWFFSENMDYSQMVISRLQTRLFGFNIDGYISQLFVENVFTEGVPTRIDPSGSLAVNWKWYTGWWRYYDREVELVDAVIHLKTDGLWKINFSVNSFITGNGGIPTFDSGITVQITPLSTGSSYYDVSLFDVDVFSESGQLSQNSGLQQYGEYFLFGASNTIKNGPATFYGIETFFMSARNSKISKIS